MEKTLCDSKGYPIAYIANDGERTICLWNGQAVAYIDEQLNCYGWNGQYLGWTEEGVLFDRLGLAVGFIKSKYPSRLYGERPKCPKSVSRVKSAKCPPCIRPEKRAGQSDLALADFLRAGVIDST